MCQGFRIATFLKPFCNHEMSDLVPEETFQKRFLETILKPSDFGKFCDSKSPNTNTNTFTDTFNIPNFSKSEGFRMVSKKCFFRNISRGLTFHGYRKVLETIQRV